MKTNPVILGTLTAVSLLCASPAAAQIHVLSDDVLARIVPRLQEIDFEEFYLTEPPDNPIEEPGLPNPLTLRGVTFTDPATESLSTGFCSSPTCVPDPDNPIEGNVALFLNPTSTITFSRPRRVVVLDVQGNGDEPLVFRVVDAQGRQAVVNSRAVMFGVALIGVTSPAGIRTIEVVQVGPQPGFYGPLSLTRVLFSNAQVRHVPRSRYSPPPKRKPVPPLRRAVSRLARS